MRDLGYFLEDHDDVCIRIEACHEDSPGAANVTVTMTKWFPGTIWEDNVTVSKCYNLEKLKYRFDDALETMYEQVETMAERKGWY